MEVYEMSCPFVIRMINSSVYKYLNPYFYDIYFYKKNNTTVQQTAQSNKINIRKIYILKRTAWTKAYVLRVPAA